MTRQQASLLRDSSATFVFSVLGLAAGFATRMCLTRGLDESAVGVLAACLALITLTAAVSQAGVPEAILYSTARAETPEQTSTAVWTGIAMVGTAACALALIAAAAVGSWDHSWSPLAMLALLIPLTALTESLGGAARGVGHQLVKLRADAIKALTLLAFIWLLWQSGRTTVARAAWAYVAAGTASFLWVAVWAIGVFRPQRPEWKAAEGLAKYGVPLATAGLLAGPLVASGIPLILAATAGIDHVAFYAVALPLQALVYLPVAATEAAGTPQWVGRIPTEHQFSRLTVALQLIASAAAAPLLLAAEPFLTLLYGPAYSAAGTTLRILVLSTLVGAALGPNEAMLRAGGQTPTIMYVKIASGVFAVVLALALTPVFGAAGAATAFAGANILTNVAYGIILYRTTNVHPWSDATRSVAIGCWGILAVAALCATAFPDASMKAAISIVTTLALLAILLAREGRHATRLLLGVSW